MEIALVYFNGVLYFRGSSFSVLELVRKSKMAVLSRKHCKN